MNKTIEYINEEIEWIKHRLDVAKTRLKNAEERKDFVSIETYKKYIDEFKQKLKLFQQIKCELEAWEVVKKYCDYQDNDRFNCLVGAFYLIEPIKGLDFVILKKALEVEDE